MFVLPRVAATVPTVVVAVKTWQAMSLSVTRSNDKEQGVLTNIEFFFIVSQHYYCHQTISRAQCSVHILGVQH